MGKKESVIEEPQIRNGCYPIGHQELVGHFYIAMEEADQMKALFAAIQKLPGATEEIKGLAKIGDFRADMLSNDFDVMRERAENAGVVEHVVPEKRNG